jgi:insulysin
VNGRQKSCLIRKTPLTLTGYKRQVPLSLPFKAQQSVLSYTQSKSFAMTSSHPPSVDNVVVVTDVMEKPSLDIRSYRVILLRNKLEVLLIHDPETDKASAALDVNVGSFSDPRDMPGLAHAVEHMLFMGTKKVRLLPIIFEFMALIWE